MFFNKKKGKSIVVILLLLLMLSTNAYANTNDGETQTITLNLIPVRNTFEKLGFKVIWNHTNKSVKLLDNGNDSDRGITLTQDPSKIGIENQIYEMKIIDGLSYIDIDYINYMGYKYEYIDANNIKIFKRIGIGSRIPTVTSKVLQEGDLDVLNKNNNPKLLFFWASWCPYCTEYINAINKITDEELMNFEIIAINIDEKNQIHNIEEYLEYNLLNAISIIDINKEIVNYYNPEAIPISYIIDENGIISDLKIGPIKKEDILMIIDENQI